MTKTGEKAFVDSGAWIALAVTTDADHARAVEIWEAGERVGVKWVTSIPVFLETFTFLDRRGSRELSLRWSQSLRTVKRLEILDCAPRQLADALAFFHRKEFHKLSLVDATSFVLMKRHAIRAAFAFDAHFAVAGFRILG
jgi:predicted nucleic acid-binding protein